METEDVEWGVEGYVNHEEEEEEEEMAPDEPEAADPHARGPPAPPGSFILIEENLRIASISLCCAWKDQGWGNQKSELFLSLTHQGEEQYDPSTLISLWGIAPHEWKREERILDASDEDFKRCILDQQRPGDKLQVLYRVGGGGGHSIHIQSLTMTVKAKVLGKEDYCHFSTAQCCEIVQQILEEAPELVLVNILGLLPQDTRKAIRASCKRLRRAVDFDASRASCVVSYGRGLCTYHQMTNRLYALGFAGLGDHGMYEQEWSLDRIGEERSVELLSSINITSVTVSCAWKDQGWGNQKSELFLSLTHQGEEQYDPSTLISLWGIAPHEWKREERVLDASDEDFKRCILDQQRPGDRLQVLYRVGGGGGHSIHIKSLETKVQGEFLRDLFEEE